MPKIGLKAHFETPYGSLWWRTVAICLRSRCICRVAARRGAYGLARVRALWAGQLLVRLDWGAVGEQACLADVCVVVES